MSGLKVTFYNRVHERFEETKPFKNLIIAGNYKHNKDQTVSYDVGLFGQSETELICVYIRDMQHTGNYTSLIEAAKKAYCKYFDTDDNNMITIERLTEQK